MNAGLRLRLVVENFEFAALDVRGVVQGHGLERVLGPGVSHAVFEPGKITRVQGDSRRDEGCQDRF